MDRYQKRIFYRPEEKGWYAHLDRAPINLGHTILRREPAIPREPDNPADLSGFQDAWVRVNYVLRRTLNSYTRPESVLNWFPDALGCVENVFAYRLGEDADDFHLHLVPFFSRQKANWKAERVGRGETGSGAILSWLGPRERQKDTRLAVLEAMHRRRDDGTSLEDFLIEIFSLLPLRDALRQNAWS
ncbi:MAG: hypothetical protein FJ279_07105 [Planctomycetes bacterium]|nr:hypothetical protein [Planctomycetota bacterium]